MQAYLTDTDTRTNVFTIHIPIEDLVTSFLLREHKAVDSNKDGAYELTDEEVISNDYKVYPGVDIPKDPFIHLEGLTQEAYLFIEIVGDSNENFNWKVRDAWMETSLTGIHGGTIYVYRGASNDAVVLDEVSGANLTEYILAGVSGNDGGIIDVSDNYKNKDKIDVVFYGYLVQNDDFADYADAYNTLVSN